MKSDTQEQNALVTRRSFLERASLLPAILAIAQSLRLPLYAGLGSELTDPSSGVVRPAWLREGVVGAWHMEALEFYMRRGYASVTGNGPVDLDYLWKEAFKETTVQHYKELGINLVIMPLQKGAGLKAESKSIEATRKFTENAHRHGIRVGGYIGSTMMYETLYAEEPDASNWEQIDERGRPIYYYDQTFRHIACRNNPGYRTFILKILRLGIQDLKLDMVHFDQLLWRAEPWSCHCNYCLKGFRAFLRKNYTDDQLTARFGHGELEGIRIPDFNIGGYFVTEGGSAPILVKDPLLQEWTKFRCASLAEWWREIHEYVRKLNPEVALLGVTVADPQQNPGFIYGVDVQQLLPNCDFIWTEDENDPRWTPDECLVSRIRTYKMTRAFGRTLLVWQGGVNKQGRYRPPYDASSIILGVAESLAYNNASLGVWNSEEGEEPPPRARQYIDFFHTHIDLLRNTTPVSDVAILRSFVSIEFNPAQTIPSTILFEQTLIQHKFAFGIILDTQLKDLGRYKVLVLANQDALSDQQIAQIRQFVETGGGLVVTGETSVLNEWRRKREKVGLADMLSFEEPMSGGKSSDVLRREFGKGRVVYIPQVEPTIPPPTAIISYDFSNRYWKLPKNHEQLVEAVSWAARGRFSVRVDAPLWVTMELTEQKRTGTWLLHLLNFKIDEPLRNIPVEIQVPDGARLSEVLFETPDKTHRQALQPSGVQGMVKFTVPYLDSYDLIILRMVRA